MDHRKINKRVFECLIKSGTLDPFGIERSYMMAQLPSILQQSEQQAQNQARGQFDLFGASEMVVDERLGEVKPWTSKERLQGEIESLGTYLSGHPVQIVEPILKKISAVKYKDIRAPKKDQKFIIAGTIVSIKSLQTKNGDRMAVILLDDSIERFEVTVFSEPFQLYRDLLIKDSLVILEVTAQRDAESGIVKVRTQKVDTLESYQSKHAKQLHLKLLPEQVNDDFINKLKDCLILSERGACPIYFDYFHQEAKVRVKLDDKWNVQINERLINQLRETVGEAALEVLF
jgi:DNA polymerase-3 subunit alpha